MKIKLTALVAGFALAVGLPLAAMAGPLPNGTDTDGDGVEDQFDNCSSGTFGVNPTQKDVDHDGCGDSCDADFDQNGGAGGSDFSIFKLAFGTSTGQPAYNASADLDCDGGIGGADFSLFKLRFGTTAGPSGISNAGRNMTACP